MPKSITIYVSRCRKTGERENNPEFTNELGMRELQSFDDEQKAVECARLRTVRLLNEGTSLLLLLEENVDIFVRQSERRFDAAHFDAKMTTSVRKNSIQLPKPEICKKIP